MINWMWSLKKLPASALAFGIAIVALLAVTAEAKANPVTAVTSASALGGNDTLDWSQLGTYGTFLTGPLSVTSTNGIGVAVSSASQAFEADQQATPSVANTGNYGGNFAVGAPILANTGSSGSTTFTFASGYNVTAVGFQSGIGITTGYNLTLTAYDASNAVIGSVNEVGNTTYGAGNTAAFNGLISSVDISKLVVSFVDYGTGDFFGNFDIADTLASPTGGSTDVPEPASLALLIAGVGGFGFLAASRRRNPRGDEATFTASVAA